MKREDEEEALSGGRYIRLLHSIQGTGTGV